MSTLHGRDPLIAIRTRSRKPASLQTVVLAAAVTLALAMAAMLMTESDGGSAGQPAQPAAVSASHADPPAPAKPLSPGERYDGGPDEGSRGFADSPGSTDFSRPHYEGRDLVPGR
jgi:hypothetical protein